MISIVVPVYCAEERLRICIDSILRQTNPDFELILVDDGSTDQSSEICDAYAAADPRVRVFHIPNGGVVKARNLGADAAKGSFLCFVDSDDTVSDELVETLSQTLREADADPDIILFSYRSRWENHEEENLLQLRPGYYSRAQIRKEILPFFINDRRGRSWPKNRVPVYVWGKAFRKSFFLRHRMTEEKIAMGEDAAIVFECLSFSRSVVVCDRVLYEYDRTREASVTRAYRTDLMQQYERQFVYLSERIGGRSGIVDAQLNNYFASRILRIVYIEVEHDRPVRQAAAHLRENFRQTAVLNYVHYRGLPIYVKVFIGMLRIRLYALILLILKAEKYLRKYRKRFQ